MLGIDSTQYNWNKLKQKTSIYWTFIVNIIKKYSKQN